MRFEVLGVRWGERKVFLEGYHILSSDMGGDAMTGSS